jgi:hypothetical protein
MLVLLCALGFWSGRVRNSLISSYFYLTRYVLERLLYRLSVSKYRDRFILKGALLLSVWAGGGPDELP